MNEMMERCNWPELPERYSDGLRQAVAFVLDRFAVSGIVACGTIVRGNPDHASDLDVHVIHREPFRQRLQRSFGGVPAEIFVNPPGAIEGYLSEERASRRPLTAHMLATGFVVLDLDPVVGALVAKAKASLSRPPAAPADLTAARYNTALLYEDALDVAARDRAASRMLVCRAVTEMLNHCFTRSGLYLPRHKDLIAELGPVDPETAELARRFFEAPSLEEQLDLAGRIADRTIAARGFFEWETSPDEVR